MNRLIHPIKELPDELACTLQKTVYISQPRSKSNEQIWGRDKQMNLNDQSDHTISRD